LLLIFLSYLFFFQTYFNPHFSPEEHATSFCARSFRADSVD
jgi:hypothetical protein